MESSSTEIDSIEASEDESSEEQDTYLSKYGQIYSSEDECFEAEETYLSGKGQMSSLEDERSEKKETRLSKTREMSFSEDKCSEEQETYLSRNVPLSSSDDEHSEKTYLSKNGEIRWCTSAPAKGRRMPAQNILKITPGPTRFCISQAQDIASTFMSFFPESMENIIIDMTNLEGEKRFSNDWQKLTATEFKAFMGLLILAGGFQSSKESIGKLWDEKMGRWIFRATMSRKRFFDLLHVVTFDNPESRALRESTDKLAAIRDVWDTWSSNLSIMYNPGHDITIDEHLVPFRGSCPFREYMPHKPSRSGIKLWVACDSRSSYCWKVQVYTGKPPGEETEENLAKRVVLDLSEGLKGQNVTVGSFFTSFDLGQQLLKKKLTMTGEVCRSRPELPSDFLMSKGRRLHSSKFGFFSNTTIVSYLKTKKKMNVLLMSTFHQNPAISSRMDREPCILTDYDETRGGVDTMNKLTTAYSTIRKTSRWTLALFCDMLDIAAHNACVVWDAINSQQPDKRGNKRKVFLVQLGEALVAPAMQQRSYVHGMVRLGEALVAPAVQQRSYMHGMVRLGEALVAPAVQQRSYMHGMVRLGEAIVTPAMQQRSNLPSDCAAAREVMAARKGVAPPPAPLGKPLKKRCVFCASQRDRKTRVMCKMCGKFVCKSHYNAVCVCCIKHC
ncbi:piggyBac transposable element-derived protein 4-like isoform X3 [Brienomyrus brachyistius]|uniref:piggyBac transposable element-derived protein 4-like isoform X3 n=1 Tax=Brienomyrus brachyistius TaxID=42636 RepID=UPI0020B38ECD|nr:piggyBac transposable element-derived protein 4-like isoform X3 [Brienomyrus brachyistius]